MHEEIFLYKNNFISKKFYNSNSMIYFKNFDNSVYLFVCACVCIWLFMSVCIWLCVWLFVCVCAANVSVPIVLRKFIIFNMHVPNSNYVSFTLTHANWYLAFQNVTKFDKTVSKLVWVQKKLWKLLRYFDENKGARYKGNIFFRHAVSMPNGTFQKSKYKKWQHISILRRKKKYC